MLELVLGLGLGSGLIKTTAKLRPGYSLTRLF